jgi:hypothetical protein
MMPRPVYLLAALVALALALAGGNVTADVQDPGVCGNEVVDVPDRGDFFDFEDACVQHDACYGAGGGEAERLICDHGLLLAMRSWCTDMWPDRFFHRIACQFLAGIYYAGVRLGGGAFFQYH